MTARQRVFTFVMLRHPHGFAIQTQEGQTQLLVTTPGAKQAAKQITQLKGTGPDGPWYLEPDEVAYIRQHVLAELSFANAPPRRAQPTSKFRPF